tara:strand:+ start:375 stop:593 length:219 start_codon:yes stop_codon:yes gene_type:complete
LALVISFIIEATQVKSCTPPIHQDSSLISLAEGRVKKLDLLPTSRKISENIPNHDLVVILLVVILTSKSPNA